MTTDPIGRHVSFTSLLVGTGPRFARDAAGPVVVFYIGWKLVGLGAGVAAATVVALVAYMWERRQGRAGIAAALGLGIALIQAIVGLVSGSAIGFFAPGVIANGLYGLVFLGSVAIGRPLAAMFAREMYPFPPEVARSKTFKRIFGNISRAWGGVFVVRCAFRLVVLSWGDVDVFVLINVLTSAPLNLALMVWSLWYGRRSLVRALDAQRL